MAYTLEERCRMWLSLGDMGSRKMGKLLEVYGSARAIWEAFGAGMEKPLGACAYRILADNRNDQALDAYEKALDGKGVRVLFPQGGEYPPQLVEISYPPPVLYALGDPSVLSGSAIALVGTRTPSRYGRDMAFALGKELGQAGIAVVSGFARGVDTAAHMGCLEGGGRTVAVLGCGLDILYPPENKGLFSRMVEKNGLFLSEYPLGARPAGYHFPDRNRLISGVSHGVVLVEGRIKSGGMITIGHALDQGREVFALPGPAGKEGSEAPHQIIRDGARLITCASDILEDMGWTSQKPENEIRLSGAAAVDIPGKEAVTMLLHREDLSFEELFQGLQMDAASLNSLLTILELAGIIKKSAGNLYSLAE